MRMRMIFFTRQSLPLPYIMYYYCAKTAPTEFWIFDAFCFWSTVSKRGTHFEQSFLMLECACKMVNTLPFDIFKVSAISRYFNLRSAKTICGLFLVFWNNCRLWATRAFSIIGVCTAAFEISKPLFYHLSRWSRVRITLVKSLLCLNGTFSH